MNLWDVTNYIYRFFFKPSAYELDFKFGDRDYISVSVLVTACLYSKESIKKDVLQV